MQFYNNRVYIDMPHQERMYIKNIIFLFPGDYLGTAREKDFNYLRYKGRWYEYVYK